MNRYKSGGPSKASATTLCQKCLKRGHYSYECTAAQQERPYVSRPSRTQQLLNPKLAPKITEAVPPKPPEREDQGGSQKNSSRVAAQDSKKRSPSGSSFSSDSDSVSSISTNRSRSASPRRREDHVDNDVAGYSGSRDRAGDKNVTQERRGPRDRSRSPRRDRQSGRRGRSLSRSRSRSPYRDRREGDRAEDSDRRVPGRREARKRSLSPYSKRLTLSRGAS